MIRRPPRSTRTDTLFPYTTLFRSLYDSVSSRPLLYAFLGVGKAIILEDPSIECYAVDATILHLCKEFVDNANSLVIAFGAVPARVSNPEEEETLLDLTKHTRSEESRVGKECVSTGRYRWSRS